MSKSPRKASSISNPYAKRKSNDEKAPPSASKNSDAPVHASLNSSAYGAPTLSTFSQAFEAIEGTQHYKNEQERSASTRCQADNQGRAQQRSFETGPAAGESLPSDRAHHAWLQPHVLYVSTRQRGNGVLSYIRNVPTAVSRMTPDYVMSATRCALFLSCKYHALYPNYIFKRLAELKSDFTLRVLLVLVDVEQDTANTLLQLNCLAVQHNMTLILAWSEEEAARYLETFKAFDGKDASLIQKKEKSHFADQVADVLGTVNSVNKADSGQLLSQFTNVRSIAAASMDELGLVPGMGEVKVKRLYDAFHKPFSSRAASKRRKLLQEADEQKRPGQEPLEEKDDENETEEDSNEDRVAITS